MASRSESHPLVGHDPVGGVGAVVDERAGPRPSARRARRRRRTPLIETYWLSGWCFWRVAVLMAVMIWRVMQSSAKARKLAWCSGRKSRAAL